MSSKVRLTEAFVERAAAKDGQRTIYLDSALPGFALRVTPNGVKSFVVVRRVHTARTVNKENGAEYSRQIKFTFNHYPEVSVAKARLEAAELLAKMAKGVNPVEAKRTEAVRGFTLLEAFELYVSSRSTRRSEAALLEARHSMDKYLGAWMDRPLRSFTRTEVRKRHEDISKEVAAGKHAAGRRRASTPGKGTANNVMRLFRAVWTVAANEHEELDRYICKSIAWNKIAARKDHVDEDAMPQWWEKVHALSNPVRRDYLLFCLFTGMRRDSATAVRWEHVDWKRGMLHVPAPKGGEDLAFDLPLSTFLIELLKGRLEARMGEEWVFPADSKSGHIKQPYAKEGMGYRLHDLRRTFTTVADEIGVSDRHQKLLTNHALPKGVHENYIVSTKFEWLRGSQQRITDEILRRAQPPAGTNVVPMPRKKRGA